MSEDQPEIRVLNTGIPNGTYYLKPDGGEDLLGAIERVLIGAALEANHGNESATARALGISRYQVRYRRKKYGI
jgi:DNA-binding NtrC family response regulator